jgi:hypothetical protein
VASPLLVAHGVAFFGNLALLIDKGAQFGAMTTYAILPPT